jgi:hypothetical protein
MVRRSEEDIEFERYLRSDDYPPRWFKLACLGALVLCAVAFIVSAVFQYVSRLPH